MTNNLSYEYIRGLVCSYGCFTFCSAGPKGKKILLPAFILSMGGKDESLIWSVMDALALHNRIYKYPPRQAKNRKNKQFAVMLIVRDFGQLKNIIVPLFHKKLIGSKARQFETWLERIGSDPLVPKRYKFISKLYKSGYYDRNPKFLSQPRFVAKRSAAEHFYKVSRQTIPNCGIYIFQHDPVIP